MAWFEHNCNLMIYYVFFLSIGSLQIYLRKEITIKQQMNFHLIFVLTKQKKNNIYFSTNYPSQT